MVSMSSLRSTADHSQRLAASAASTSSDQSVRNLAIATSQLADVIKALIKKVDELDD